MEPTQQAPVSPTPEAPKTSYGALIGLVIVVVAIALAALYFLKERVDESVYTQDSRAESLAEQGTSTDPQDIQADLEAESPEEFDEELDKAFVELDAAFEGEAQ